MTYAKLLAAAGNAAPMTEFSTCDNSQWWVDSLASAFDGLILLPFALFFVWGVRRLNLNRWPFATAALATIFAVVVSYITDEYVAPIFVYSNKIIEMLGLGRFEYMALPAIFVCFAGAFVMAWTHTRREPIHTNTFE